MSDKNKRFFFEKSNELGRIREKSNSKEKIELESNHGKFFIKKTWVEIERGEKAILKQINFDEIRISDLIIRTPKVLKTELSNKKFIAFMEYIEGHSGSDISTIGSRNISLKIKDSLSILININLERSKFLDVDCSIFVKKLDGILLQIDIGSEMYKLAKDLKLIFDRQKTIKLPVGPCHGDLTLSNIIISTSGSLNLIDFLDTFINSPLWDIVKLYQDLKYGWSYRTLAGPERESARIFFGNCIPNQLRIYEEIMSDQVRLFDALNLVRLSPYIKNQETEKWLVENLKNSMSKLQN